MTTHKLQDSETVLSDDYPMYWGYVYIIDGVFSECTWEATVEQYKLRFKAKEIRRCNLHSHPGAKLGDSVE